jgi:hypothetical protein
VTAVITRGVRPVDKECNSIFEDVKEVVKSVSAAVPAPAHLTQVSYDHDVSVPYVGSDVMDFFTVFICDDGSCCCASVCS